MKDALFTLEKSNPKKKLPYPKSTKKFSLRINIIALIVL